MMAGKLAGHPSAKRLLPQVTGHSLTPQKAWSSSPASGEAVERLAAGRVPKQPCSPAALVPASRLEQQAGWNIPLRDPAHRTSGSASPTAGTPTPALPLAEHVTQALGGCGGQWGCSVCRSREGPALGVSALARNINTLGPHTTAGRSGDSGQTPFLSSPGSSYSNPGPLTLWRPWWWVQLQARHQQVELERHGHSDRQPWLCGKWTKTIASPQCQQHAHWKPDI